MKQAHIHTSKALEIVFWVNLFAEVIFIIFLRASFPFFLAYSSSERSMDMAEKNYSQVTNRWYGIEEPRIQPSVSAREDGFFWMNIVELLVSFSSWSSFFTIQLGISICFDQICVHIPWTDVTFRDKVDLLSEDLFLIVIVVGLDSNVVEHSSGILSFTLQKIVMLIHQLL